MLMKRKLLGRVFSPKRGRWDMVDVHHMCYTMLVQRFEPQGRRFTNFHYYYYYFTEKNLPVVASRVDETLILLRRTFHLSHVGETMILLVRTCQFLHVDETMILLVRTCQFLHVGETMTLLVRTCQFLHVSETMILLVRTCQFLHVGETMISSHWAWLVLVIVLMRQWRLLDTVNSCVLTNLCHLLRMASSCSWWNDGLSRQTLLLTAVS